MSADRANILIVGAGPVGLFAAFQLGLFGFKCEILDALDRPGGQCVEYYADKPIFDIPAYPSITGQDLTDRLLDQLAPYAPSFTFNTVACGLSSDNSSYRLTLSNGRMVYGSAVIVAAGWGIIGDLKSDNVANPFASWGVGLSNDLVPVDPATFGSQKHGVFAIGDMCDYPGKLRLILSGFHEAALATQAIRKMLSPEIRYAGPRVSTKRGR